MSPDRPDTDLLAAWAAGLQASLEPRALHEHARGQLLARVASSAAAHAGYTTVRRESGHWLPIGPGLAQRDLRRDARVQVSLVRVEEGSALPAGVEGTPHELLLVEGSLRHASSASVLPPYSHAVVDGPQAMGAWRAQGSALLYCRELHASPATLPDAEAQWWQGAISASAARIALGQPAWRPPGTWRSKGPGVQVLLLQAQQHVVSMLVRFEPGSGVPDHDHEIDEDCLVLDGEMFLGDILLRAGDYQLAPAGGSHFNENSDVGVCFYFHGALDAPLRGPRR